MIAKICKRGRSATGLLNYLICDRKAGHVSLDDVDAARLNAGSGNRPDIAEPFWHCALSLPDGERLGDDRRRDIAPAFVTRMGLGNHEWTAVIHNETGNQHMHLVVKRVAWNGSIWTGERDALRAIAAAKALEIEHSLPVEAFRAAGRKSPSKNEIELALRTETQPARITLRQVDDRATEDLRPIG